MMSENPGIKMLIGENQSSTIIYVIAIYFFLLLALEANLY
jgi:hypothetical protein